MNDFWIITTAILVATSNAILGSFLIMRRMAMIGDAISHAVLPGIVIAYFLTHSKASFPMLVGAAASGLLVTYVIHFFNRKVRLQMDASIGISYTFFFAVGIILISLFGTNVDLDQECVLYGEIIHVPFDLQYFKGLSLGPRQVSILGFNLILTIVAIAIGYRKLILTTFDESFAAATGINVIFWQYYLMGGVSLTTVVSFESVGAILVIAFLVGPAATAYLITSQFKRTMLLAVVFGVSSSILGFYLASWIDGSIAGAISTVIGIQFFVVFAITQISKSRNRHESLEDFHLNSSRSIQ